MAKSIRTLYSFDILRFPHVFCLEENEDFNNSLVTKFKCDRGVSSKQKTFLLLTAVMSPSVLAIIPLALAEEISLRDLQHKYGNIQ
jgi:hypothetical protein